MVKEVEYLSEEMLTYDLGQLKDQLLQVRGRKLSFWYS